MAEDDILDGVLPPREGVLTVDEKAERRRLRKIEDAMETGSLEPWERYRVLTDVLDHYQDLAEMADRKSRFALVILGALNALNLIVIVRPEVRATDLALRSVPLGIYFAVYFGISLYLFAQAIGALKPRILTVLSRIATPEGATRPILGLRFVKNILDSSFEEYYEKWKQAQFADVNREVALHVRQLAAIVTAKYQTLHRLYTGLMVLVFLTAGLITLLIFNRLLP